MFLHSGEVAGKGGCSKGDVSLVFHDTHIPRSLVHSNTGVDLVPWNLMTAQILQAHLKYIFVWVEGPVTTQNVCAHLLWI